MANLDVKRPCIFFLLIPCSLCPTIIYPCRNTSLILHTAQPRSFFGMESTKKQCLQLCMRCVSALKCMAQVLCNWCLLISSWLRPALVSTGLNSNFGKGKISLGSDFWFPFTIYQGRTSSTFQHCAMSLLCPASRAFQRYLRSYSPFSA